MCRAPRYNATFLNLLNEITHALLRLHQRAELWLKDQLRQTLYKTWQLYELVKSQWIPAAVSDKVDSIEIWVAPKAAKALEMLFGVKVRQKAT